MALKGKSLEDGPMILVLPKPAIGYVASQRRYGDLLGQFPLTQYSSYPWPRRCVESVWERSRFEAGT
jgi:hypothetical protein